MLDSYTRLLELIELRYRSDAANRRAFRFFRALFRAGNVARKRGISEIVLPKRSGSVYTRTIHVPAPDQRYSGWGASAGSGEPLWMTGDGSIEDRIVSLWRRGEEAANEAMRVRLEFEKAAKEEDILGLTERAILYMQQCVRQAYREGEEDRHRLIEAFKKGLA